MKNLGLYIVFLVCLLSCNVPIDDKNENIPTSKLEVLTSLSDEDTTSKKIEPINNNLPVTKTAKLLLTARGSEPGWYAEFFADHLRLLIDNGTDSLILNNDFSRINIDKAYTVSMAENNANNKQHPIISLSISIQNKACVEEASGMVREKSISINFNNKIYKGCARAQ